MSASKRQKLLGTLLLKYIGKPSPIEEMRMTFYRVIIVNMFWIDGVLPKDPTEKFEFFINPDWANGKNPDNYLGLRHLSEAMLNYVCARFSRPTWVGDPKALRLSMSLNEIVTQWPFLFDLPDTSGEGSSSSSP
jgi:hypothetical protein